MPTISQPQPSQPTQDTGLSTYIKPVSQSSCLSVLFKGPAGSGKTRSALTFPGPILSIYADVNRDTLRTMSAQGVEVMPMPVESWSFYQDKVVPLVKARRLGLPKEPRTIVVDTIDFLSDLMWREIQGSKSNLSQPDFGKGLRQLMTTTRDLVYATSPRGDHPGYHVVFNCHIRDVTDDSGSLVKIAPAIMGQFKDQIEDCFDYVLITQSEVASNVTDGRVQKVRQFKIFTAPPDRYQTAKGGSLPTEIIVPNDASTFDLLNQHWKIKVDEESSE